MDRGRRDPEVALQISFRRRPAEHERIGMDEGQILALLGGEPRRGSWETNGGRLIHLWCPHQGGAAMNLRYRVELSQTERERLKGLLSGGKQAARKLKRAQILLAADAGASDEAIAVNLGVGGSTVYRTKRRFVLADL